MDQATQTLSDALLDIAGRFPTPAGDDTPTAQGSLPSDLLAHAQQAMSHVALTEQQVVLLAVLFHELLEGHLTVKTHELLARVCGDPRERVEGLGVVSGLLDTGLVNLTKGPDRGEELRLHSRPPLGEVMAGSLRLTENTLRTILGQNGLPERSLLPYADYREYLLDWFEYVGALERSVAEQALHEAVFRAPKRSEIPGRIRARIAERNRLTQQAFPLDLFVEENKLDEEEKVIVAALLKHDLADDPTTVELICKMLAGDPLEHQRIRRYFEPGSRLLAKGIITMGQRGPFFMRGERVSLTSRAMEALIETARKTCPNPLEEIIKQQEIFQLIDPPQSLQDLVLPESLMRLVNVAILRYRRNVDHVLKEWGVDKPDRVLKEGECDEAPLRLLITGPSGTGKTFAAGAIARELGKRVLVTDISRLLSMWVGGSEQHVREFFDLQDRIIRECPNPPVLLLNECDQFLQRRCDASHSVDRMYNQMQDLFLEGLEKMRGVLIATTNVSGLMDEAFSRRFHLKLEFPMPDLETRKALWVKYLPDSLPRTGDVDINRLAVAYEFSGGQISLVVRNAATEAAIRGDQLTMNDLIAASEAEVQGMLHSAGQLKGAVGF